MGRPSWNYKNWDVTFSFLNSSANFLTSLARGNAVCVWGSLVFADAPSVFEILLKVEGMLEDCRKVRSWLINVKHLSTS